MKAASSVIDNHPQRDKIISLILAGKGVREISAMTRPRVSFNSVQRYKANVVRPAVATIPAREEMPSPSDIVKQTGQLPVTVREAIRQSPVRDRIQTLHERASRALDKVEGMGEAGIGMIAPLIGQSLRGVELLAKITGELNENAHNTAISIQVVVPVSGASEVTERQPVTFDVAAVDVTESTT